MIESFEKLWKKGYKSGQIKRSLMTLYERQCEQMIRVNQNKMHKTK